MKMKIRMITTTMKIKSSMMGNIVKTMVGLMTQVLSITGLQEHSFALRRLIYLEARLFQKILNDLLHLTVSALRKWGQLQEWKASLTHQMV